MSFLEDVKAYLEEAAGGPGQKREAWAAAKEVARIEGPLAACMQVMFFRWLMNGGWLTEVKPSEWRLPDERYLSETKIREHYPATPYKQAVERATAAWEARVKRCAAHLAAGWPIDEAMCFVYTREELREALKRAGRKAGHEG